jgi:nucleoid DNA-binding protein
MPTVTKKDVVNRLTEKLGVTQAQSTEMLESLLEIFSSALADGDAVALRTFGTFEIRLTQSKLGRNPARPEMQVHIPPRYVVKFKPGRELKQRIADLPMPPPGDD